VRGFGGGRREGKRPLGKPRSTWGMILKWIFKKCKGGIDWMIWLGIGANGILAVSDVTNLCLGFRD
jgi:hypothetical protein